MHQDQVLIGKAADIDVVAKGGLIVANEHTYPHTIIPHIA
jgi:hypothetical protein